MRILCVAEKPSQAKAVVQILSQGQPRTREGCSRYNKNYDFQYRVAGAFVEATMTSVLGHVVELDFPQTMRRWQSCNPVALFTAPIVTTVERSKDVARNIEREARTATHLYIWTDCDREGESIGCEIADICRSSNSRIVVKRAHFSSVLPQEIHQAMQNPRELDMRLVAAVQARTELDLRIGSALTRFQTLRLQSRFAAVQDKLVSYGPCQFPTLGFVVDQFRRVEGFVPEAFWFAFLEHEKNDGRATFLWRRQRLFDQEACFALYAKCMQAPTARVRTARSRPQEKWRPLPLTTVELQKCCARFLRLAPDQIMTIAEGLYNQGFVSYPRTETDQFDRNMDLQGTVTKLTQYHPFADYAQRLVSNNEFRWPRQGRNNDKAHPPIHPVAPANNLTGDPKRVYEFITRRFLACCSDNAKGQATEVEVDVAGELFHTKGLAIVARNYLDIYPYDRWSESTVPVYTQGDTFEPTTLEMRSGTTTAPKLLTDADLVDAMEKNGIGTDATHAEHIKKIIDREYVFKSREGYLTPSTLGIGLVEGYDDIGLELSLSKPYLRREMERELRRICSGAKTKEEVIRDSINLYQAVYTRSVEQVDRLEQALSRCLGEQPLDGAGGGWTPGPADAAADEVCRCPGCGNGTMSLRSRVNGGWMIGCSLYPQCRRAVWVPAAVVGISVSTESCALCETAATGTVKLLDIRFRPGAVPPGTPNPYRGCVLGCDELVNELFDSPPAGGAGRQQPPAPPPGPPPPGPPPGPPRPPSAPAPAALQQSHNSWPSNGIASGRQSPAASLQQSDQWSQPNGAAGGPPCQCNAPSVRRVTAKEGPNKGRPFYVCSKGRDARCDYFQWADQPGTANGAGAGGGSSSSSFQSPAPGGSFGQHFGEPPTTKPKCRCGLYAALKTKAPTGDNQGREYYVCTREFLGCGFVCWKDEVEAYNAGTRARPPPPAGAASSECFKCHQVGHWSRDCPNASGSGSDFASGPPPPQQQHHSVGGPARRARGKSRAPSTRGRRGRGRGRGAGSSRSRTGGAKNEGGFADPDPGFGSWS